MRDYSLDKNMKERWNDPGIPNGCDQRPDLSPNCYQHNNPVRAAPVTTATATSTAVTSITSITTKDASAAFQEMYPSGFDIIVPGEQERDGAPAPTGLTIVVKRDVKDDATVADTKEKEDKAESEGEGPRLKKRNHRCGRGLTLTKRCWCLTL